MLVLTRQDGVPLLPFLLNGAGLDRACHLTVEFDLDVPDFREVQPSVIDLATRSPRQQGTPLISPYLKVGVLRGEWIKTFTFMFHDTLLL